MKKTSKAMLVALGLALAFPVSAIAQGGPRLSFDAIDADGNGEVTQAEIAAFRTAKFTAEDSDGDGFLDTDELTQAGRGERAAQRAERLLDRQDANNDGQLSLAEFTPPADRAEERFARLDSDGNGTLSQAEFEAGMKRGAGRRMAQKQ